DIPAGFAANPHGVPIGLRIVNSGYDLAVAIAYLEEKFTDLAHDFLALLGSDDAALSIRGVDQQVPVVKCRIDRFGSGEIDATALVHRENPSFLQDLVDGHEPVDGLHAVVRNQRDYGVFRPMGH